MRIYKIPVIWKKKGLVKVKANNLEEAKRKALSIHFPKGYCVDNSFKIDKVE